MTRTVLPLPEQNGFRVRLPERVCWAPDIDAVPGPDGLALSHHGTSLSVSMPLGSCVPFVRALARHGPGLATDTLAVTWTQLVEHLAAQGIIDAAPTVEQRAGCVPALTAIVDVQSAVHQERQISFTNDHPLNLLLAGRLETDAAVRWLVGNYHYTRSARHHIAPVLEHPMDDDERRIWERFLADESWHWRIYRPALGQWGLTFAELDARRPHPATQRFVASLRAAARSGPVAYAATMLFIEKAPTWSELHADPLYTSLVDHYGFSLSSVRPLWWHDTENSTAGHSALGAVVISRRRWVDAGELDGAVAAVRRTIRAVSAWYREILESRAAYAADGRR